MSEKFPTQGFEEPPENSPKPEVVAEFRGFTDEEIASHIKSVLEHVEMKFGEPYNLGIRANVESLREKIESTLYLLLYQKRGVSNLPDRHKGKPLSSWHRKKYPRLVDGMSMESMKDSADRGEDVGFRVEVEEVLDITGKSAREREFYSKLFAVKTNDGREFALALRVNGRALW